jgi:hypothetical protein
LTLLGQCRVIDDKKTCGTADQAICLPHQGRLKWIAVPNPGSDEMMKLIVIDMASPRRHRLHALAVARPDQTGNVERAHPAPRWMRKPRQKRRKPAL